jgi:histidinol-phosphate aminotransferase
MKAYTPIEPVDILSQRAKLPMESVVKLDGNENPYSCSPKVRKALANYSRYHIYPDPMQRELRQALEEYTGLDCRYIVCGSGSDELIDLVLRLFLEPGDEVINCPTTFGVYPFCTNVCGGKVVNIPRNEDFALDIAAIKRALNKKTKVIFIASPNNPTGNVITEQEMVELVETGKIVVVDEAYFEFSSITMVNLVPNYSNLIVLRTFSKWAGLAGLRIGYGIFPIEIASYLMKIKQPYNVNVAAEVAALASLADIDYLRGNVAKITAERERLFDKLRELDWLKPYPSSGNFILCSLKCYSGGAKRPKNLAQGNTREESQAKKIWRQLQKKGIFIRYFDRPRLRDCLRISVGKPEDTDALIEALSSAEVHPRQKGV